jgi:hypothetical protein
MHCCNNINIIRSETFLKLSGHHYRVVIHHCDNCGSKKETSHVKHVKENKC